MHVCVGRRVERAGASRYLVRTCLGRWCFVRIVELCGLAISSRNSYLSSAERATALALSSALRAGAAAAGEGRTAVLAAARAELSVAATADPPLMTDYLALADPTTFAEVGPGYTGPALLLVAGTVGKTRLIDNFPLVFGPRS